MKRVFENMTPEELTSHLSLDNLEKALKLFERVQQDACRALQERDKGQLGIRIGTVLTFGFLEELMRGRTIAQFTGDEWKKIADSVAVYGVEIPDSQYSEFIFEMYAKYLSISAAGLRRNALQNGWKTDNLDEIDKIIGQIRKDSKDLRTWKIGEPDYVEKSLWNCFETVMKLLSAWLHVPGGEEINELKDAAVTFAVQYAWLIIYKKELTSIEEIEAERAESKEKYRKQYNAFVREMEEKADEFEGLLDHAFAADFSERLRGSAELARSAGVPKSEILDSTEAIDDFFIN